MTRPGTTCSFDPRSRRERGPGGSRWLSSSTPPEASTQLSSRQRGRCAKRCCLASGRTTALSSLLLMTRCDPSARRRWDRSTTRAARRSGSRSGRFGPGAPRTSEPRSSVPQMPCPSTSLPRPSSTLAMAGRRSAMPAPMPSGRGFHVAREACRDSVPSPSDPRPIVSASRRSSVAAARCSVSTTERTLRRSPFIFWPRR